MSVCRGEGSGSTGGYRLWDFKVEEEDGMGMGVGHVWCLRGRWACRVVADTVGFSNFRDQKGGLGHTTFLDGFRMFRGSSLSYK